MNTTPVVMPTHTNTVVNRFRWGAAGDGSTTWRSSATGSDGEGDSDVSAIR